MSPRPCPSLRHPRPPLRRGRRRRRLRRPSGIPTRWRPSSGVRGPADDDGGAGAAAGAPPAALARRPTTTEHRAPVPLRARRQTPAVIASVQDAPPVAIHTDASVSCTTAVLWRFRGRLQLTVVVKSVFALVPDGAATHAGPGEIVAEDRTHGGHPSRSVEVAGDLAPYLTRCDVLFTGHAHAPGGRRPPARSTSGSPARGVRCWTRRSTSSATAGRRARPSPSPASPSSTSGPWAARASPTRSGPRRPTSSIPPIRGGRWASGRSRGSGRSASGCWARSTGPRWTRPSRRSRRRCPGTISRRRRPTSRSIGCAAGSGWCSTGSIPRCRGCRRGCRRRAGPRGWWCAGRERAGSKRWSWGAIRWRSTRIGRRSRCRGGGGTRWPGGGGAAGAAGGGRAGGAGVPVAWARLIAAAPAGAPRSAAAPDKADGAGEGTISLRPEQAAAVGKQAALPFEVSGGHAAPASAEATPWGPGRSGPRRWRRRERRRWGSAPGGGRKGVDKRTVALAVDQQAALAQRPAAPVALPAPAPATHAPAAVPGAPWSDVTAAPAPTAAVAGEETLGPRPMKVEPPPRVEAPLLAPPVVGDASSIGARPLRSPPLRPPAPARKPVAARPRPPEPAPAPAPPAPEAKPPPPAASDRPAGSVGGAAGQLVSQVRRRVIRAGGSVDHVTRAIATDCTGVARRARSDRPASRREPRRARSPGAAGDIGVRGPVPSVGEHRVVRLPLHRLARRS